MGSRSAFAHRRRLLQQKQRAPNFRGTNSTWNSWRDTGEFDSDDEDDAFSSSSLSSISTIDSGVSEFELVDDNSGTINDGDHQPNSTTTTIMIAIPSPSSSPNDEHPPTPWAKSTAKKRIIDELSDPTSNIHLFIGQYKPPNFANVNFSVILNKYAGDKYKSGNFKDNMKRLLTHLYNNTGPFEEVCEGRRKDKVEKWYTSANNVSKAYSLLFSLLMNDAGFKVLSRMNVKEIWQSDPQFQQYELEKFKEYYKNMLKRTNTRKRLLLDENKAYHDDMLKCPRRQETIRGYPFWDTHKASELLEEDEESGKAKELTPKELWATRKEYQDFPLSVFRKHIYQLRSKRSATIFWQYKRNMNARKKYEEVEGMMKEWYSGRCDDLIEDLDKMTIQEPCVE